MKAKPLAAVLILSILFVTANRNYACPPPNQDPKANLTVDPEYVMKDVNATLDGSGSYDPDGSGGINGIKKFEWDFNYDPCGGFDPNYWETESNPGDGFNGITKHQYGTAGIYKVKLRVTDFGSPGKTDLSPTRTVYVNIRISVPNDVNSIQGAIDKATDGLSTVVVSEDTYYENIDFKGKGITLTSTDPNNPDVVATTIIADDPCDANGTIVTFKTAEDANSVLTGFTITDGNAYYGGGIYCSDASPTISNCVIIGNKTSWQSSGAGMYNTNNSDPLVINCVFSKNMTTNGLYGYDHGGGMYNNGSDPNVINCVFMSNIAGNNGGGMVNYESSPAVINCVFSRNCTTYNNGGGMYNDHSSPTIINCTFSGNYAATKGGGISNYFSDYNVTNCIFWGNHAYNINYNEIYNDNSNPTFEYCDIEGDYVGVGNIKSDPNFVDTTNPAGPDGAFGTWDDGLRIMAYSPCVDKANSSVDGFQVTDITGRERVDVPYANPNVDSNCADIGAYESPTVWFVDANVNDSNDGSSWEEAFEYLQDAFLAADGNDGDEIWVTNGNYYPDQNSTAPSGNGDRNATFQLINGVGVYGGFAGEMTGPQRSDPTTYETILSGDINNVGDQNDNSYHVVIGADGAILDGFTITGGYADAIGIDGEGSGIYCYDTSPTINNCLITGNYAEWYGGGIYCWGLSASAPPSPTINNCKITNNKTGSTGGGGGMLLFTSSPIVTNCFFSDNDANYGGGLYHCCGSKPILTNCVFSGNTANSDGGGMYSSGAKATLINCTFSKNEANNGGGVYKYESSNSTMTNCIFWGNTANVLGKQIAIKDGSVSVSYSCIQEESEPNNIISYWKFDKGEGSTAYDSAGDNNGIISGAEWTTGQIGAALFFGDGNYVSVPDDNSLDITNNLTISAWAKRTGAGSSNEMIVSKSATGDYSYRLFFSSTNTVRWWLSSDGGTSNREYVNSTSTITDTDWHHIVATFASGTLKIYIDGANKTSSSTGNITSIHKSAQPVLISKENAGTYFDGTIDEVMILDRALSHDEVRQLYHNVLISTGEGNIDDDPCFVDANDPNGPDDIFGTQDDGLQLTADSNCIDAADGDAAPSADILGYGRVDMNDVDNNGVGEPNYVDMGAYESGPAVVVMCWIDESHHFPGGIGDEEAYYRRGGYTTFTIDLTAYRNVINSEKILVVKSGCLVPPDPNYPEGINAVLPEEYEYDPNYPPEGISIEECNRWPDTNDVNEFIADFDRIRDGIEPDYVLLSVDNSGSMTTLSIQTAYGQFKTWLGDPNNYDFPKPSIVTRDGEIDFTNERWVDEMRIQIQNVLDDL
jgi:hypothetical protein